MVMRQISSQRYGIVCSELSRIAYKEPLRASFLVDLKVNSIKYQLAIQPDRHNKVVALHAVCVSQDEAGKERFELLTEPMFLIALLDVWLVQLLGSIY